MFLVTGCERSGTMWSARFFTELGFSCGHEHEYNPWKTGPLTGNESSWMAVPYLEELPENTRIVWNVRNPFDMVESSIARGFLRNLSTCPYSTFVANHRPDIVEPSDHLGRVIRYVALWDSPLNDVTHHPFRVDRATTFELDLLVYGATGTLHPNAPGAAMRVGTKVNSGPKKKNLRNEIKNHPEGYRIVNKARDWGYVD